MKHLLATSISIALLSLGLAGCGEKQATKEVTSDAFVTIQGQDLIKPDGTKLFIMGTNLGNWLNPEGYMFKFNKTNSGRFINEMFCQLVGPDFTADFWKAFKDNYVTREDIRFIKEQGANTIRLALNQHVQYFYDLCDEVGMVDWAEIPYITEHMPNGRENTISQMKELIIQNYNHPSIMYWGLSNEILIGGICQELVDNHHDLQKLCKELDPTRSTTIAHVSHTPTDGPMHHITDLESYNHYFGWYGGKIEDNGPWLDKFHAEHPDICIGISEYGTEGIINWFCNDPQCKDYTEEYQALYHEHLAQVFEDRPWVWATHCWNMLDFGCSARNEGGVAGRINKGLMTIDR